MYRCTEMAVIWRNIINIFSMANAPICELRNKSAATLGDRKSIILVNKQGLFLLFMWRTFSFRKYKFHAHISTFKIKWYQIKPHAMEFAFVSVLWFLQQFQAWRVLNLNEKIFALHIKENKKITVLNKLNRLCHATWFCWYKLFLFLLPPGWDASASQVNSSIKFAGTLLYTWVERDTVRVTVNTRV